MIRVYICDDIEEICVFFKNIIDADSDMEVVGTGSSGKKAVDDAARLMPDAVLMDIQMPVMNGYEATKSIRALENNELSSVPIVAMTANAFDEDRKATEECGMNGFISKPINMEEVIGALHSVLSKK